MVQQTDDWDIRYPESTDNVELWDHLHILAQDTDDAITRARTVLLGTWTPTLTAITVGAGGGAGLVVARYRFNDAGMVDYRFKFKLGSASAIGSNPAFTLPVAPHASYGAFEDSIGLGILKDASAGAARQCQVFISSGSTAQINGWDPATGGSTAITATAPWTWTTSDTMAASGSYEPA